MLVRSSKLHSNENHRMAVVNIEVFSRRLSMFYIQAQGWKFPLPSMKECRNLNAQITTWPANAICWVLMHLQNCFSWLPVAGGSLQTLHHRLTCSTFPCGILQKQSGMETSLCGRLDNEMFRGNVWGNWITSFLVLHNSCIQWQQCSPCTWVAVRMGCSQSHHCGNEGLAVLSSLGLYLFRWW